MMFKKYFIKVKIRNKIAVLIMVLFNNKKSQQYTYIYHINQIF